MSTLFAKLRALRSTRPSPPAINPALLAAAARAGKPQCTWDETDQKKTPTESKEEVQSEDEDNEDIVMVLPPLDKKKVNRKEWRRRMVRDARERYEKGIRDRLVQVWEQGKDEREALEVENETKKKVANQGDDLAVRNGDAEVEESVGKNKKEEEEEEGEENEALEDDEDEESSEEEELVVEEDLDEEELLRRLKEKEDRKLNKLKEKRKKKEHARKASTEEQKQRDSVLNVRMTLIGEPHSQNAIDVMNKKSEPLSVDKSEEPEPDLTQLPSLSPEQTLVSAPFSQRTVQDNDGASRNDEKLSTSSLITGYPKASTLIENEAEDDCEDKEDTEEDYEHDDAYLQEKGEQVDGENGFDQIQEADPNQMRAFHLQWEQARDRSEVPKIQEEPSVGDQTVLLQRCKTDRSMFDAEDIVQPDTEDFVNKKEEESDEKSVNEECTNQISPENPAQSEPHETYVEDMFKITESDSLLGNLDEDDKNTEDLNSELETRRLKAKALWKARQKSKILRGNSEISVFGRYSEETLQNRERFRQQIEQAVSRSMEVTKDIGPTNFSGLSKIRTGKSKSKSQNATSTKSMSEWETRKLCLTRAEARRKSGPALTLWASAVSSKEKELKRKQSKSDQSALYTGSLNKIHRKRPRENLSVPVDSQSFDGNNQSPERGKRLKVRTTFKGLFKVLAGTTAKNDWSH